MFDKKQDIRHVKKLFEIKLRNNQYLPNINKYLIHSTTKKLDKSKSEFFSLSNKIKSNRKNLNSVNKALLKRKPVDYYQERKYLYEKDIERVRQLLLNNLQNKNNKLEDKLKIMKKTMVKIPLYKLNGMRNTKRTSLIKLFSNDGDTKEENKDYYKHKEYNEDQNISKYNTNYSKVNLRLEKIQKSGLKNKNKYLINNILDDDD